MSKRLVMIVVPVVLLVAAAAALVLSGMINIQIGGTAAAPAPTAVPVESHGVPVTLGERIVNLADPGGFRYLKTEIVLDLSAEGVSTGELDPDTLQKAQSELNAKLDPVRPRIQDVLTTVLTSKTVEEVSTPEGKEALKQELLAQLQPVLPYMKIHAVYFAQFVIQ